MVVGCSEPVLALRVGKEFGVRALQSMVGEGLYIRVTRRVHSKPAYMNDLHVKLPSLRVTNSILYTHAA